MKEDPNNGPEKVTTEPATLDAPRDPQTSSPDILTAPSGNRLLPWIVFAVVVIVLVTVVWIYVRHNQALQALTPSRGGRGGGGEIPVVAAVAHRGDLTVHLDAPGTVQPWNTVTVHTRVDGQIDTVAFVEGQIVNKGDVLVQIDPRPFQAALDTAKGQLAKDTAMLNGAQKDLDFYKSVSASAIAVQTIEDQKAMVQQMQGSVEADKAQVESAQVNLNYCTITAPISGRIGLRLVDAGNIVHASDATGIAVITQLQPIAVVFSLPQVNLAQLPRSVLSGAQVGTAADPQTESSLQVMAYDPAISTKLADGQLVTIDNQIDPTTSTFKVKSRFANENNLLYPNEFVNARLAVSTLRNVVIVPSAAVQSSPSSSYVYAVSVDDATTAPSPTRAPSTRPGAADMIHGTAHLRTVQVGYTEGEQAVIESGVSAGDLVVTEGVDKLVDGTKVSMRTATAAPGPRTGPAPANAAAATRPARNGTSPRRPGIEKGLTPSSQPSVETP